MKRTPRNPDLAKEVVLQAKNLTKAEIRFSVSNYLDIQERRKRADMQIRHLGDKDEIDERGSPKSHSKLLELEGDTWAKLEEVIKKSMYAYADNDPIGQWLLSILGVGGVIAAGLLAHIDIEKAKTAGSLWRFAGQDPSLKWEKGQKRGFNAALKQICYHFAECQVRLGSRPDAFYRQLYDTKKAELIIRNERGGFTEKAKVYKGVSDPANKKLLAQGKVPAGYIDKMARRFATKIFLSHLHGIMHFLKFGTVPLPFAHAHLGHIHLLDVPNHSMFPGFIEAYQSAGRRLEAAE